MTSADQLVVLTPAPPDEKFWRRYSREFEFPISLLSSLFLMSLAFGLLALFLILAVGPPREKRSPPISMVDGGASDVGDGTANAGGAAGDDRKADPTTPVPTLAEKIDASQAALPDVKAPTTDAPSVESTSESSATPADSFARLEEALQAKLRDSGGKDGPAGKGVGPNDKPGEAGAGGDPTKARGLRWSMKFVTSSGRDYLDQLNALGAVVLVEVPPEKSQVMIFRDLKNPKPGTMATESDLARLFGQVRFYDNKRQSAREVGQALGLDFVPESFGAFFPRAVEEEMARLERNHNGLRPEQIAQTRFQVQIINGKYKLSVFEQVRK